MIAGVAWLTVAVKEGLVPKPPTMKPLTSCLKPAGSVSDGRPLGA
jgi:hypothetical protein